MNDLYAGGVYGFQGIMDPILESELRKCKTQEERDEIISAYQTTLVLSLIVVIVIGVAMCGVITFFTK